MCDRVTRLFVRLMSKHTIMCLIRLGGLLKIGHYCTKPSPKLGSLLLISSTADAVEVRKSAVVEPLTVVWDVKESVYISSSLLSSSPDMGSGKDGAAFKEFFCLDSSLEFEVPDSRSAEASFTIEASSCWGGLALGLVVLLGLPWGTLATLGISSLPSSSSSELEMPSPFIPPCGLTLPCRGNNRFLCRTLVLPPCNTFHCVHRDTRGRLAYHLVFLTLPSILDLVPAFPGSLFYQH